MSRKDWTSSEASLQAKCLIMSDLQIPHSESEEKVTYITTNQKKNTNGPVLFSSPPLHSLFLSIFAAPFLAALFLSHFVTPHLSLSFPRQRLGELSPLIQMRKVVCMKVCFGGFFASVCACLPACAHSVCVFVIWSILLKWYGRQRVVVRWSNQPATR